MKHILAMYITQHSKSRICSPSSTRMRTVDTELSWPPSTHGRGDLRSRNRYHFPYERSPVNGAEVFVQRRERKM